MHASAFTKCRQGWQGAPAAPYRHPRSKRSDYHIEPMLVSVIGERVPCEMLPDALALARSSRARSRCSSSSSRDAKLSQLLTRCEAGDYGEPLLDTCKPPAPAISKALQFNDSRSAS